MQVYLHIYIHIYDQVAHNFGTFYATKLKFGMVFTQTKTLDFMVELPLGEARGQNGVGAKEAILAKAVVWGHQCTLDTCLVDKLFSE